jgi:transposase
MTRVRNQKTDRQDAQLILRLMLENRFSKIWVPSWENRDLRQLLWHRHRMVQARTRIMNQLQAVALNEGPRCKKRLWRDTGREQLESFALAPWASRRRRDLLELLARLTPTIAELTEAIEQEVEKCPKARRLQTHPGVGTLTALAFVLIIGRAERFQCGKQIASYLGLVPLEDSSGQRCRLGHITKQGNSLLRFLLVEAAQVTVRSDPEWRSKYFHLATRRERKIAKAAMARRLAVRLYWMWRKGWDYAQWKKFGSHAGQPGKEAVRSHRSAACKKRLPGWLSINHSTQSVRFIFTTACHRRASACCTALPGTKKASAELNWGKRPQTPPLYIDCRGEGESLVVRRHCAGQVDGFALLFRPLFLGGVVRLNDSFVAIFRHNVPDLCSYRLFRS